MSDVIRRIRIHDCGLLPANNHEHGIYLSYAESTQILDNVIFDNADRGIQLYPDAQHTVVRGNVIDGNGEGIIFSGVGGTASSDNVVENNVITNSRIRHDVESWYPDVVGTGNVVRNNCVHGGAEGSIAAPGATLPTSPPIWDYADRRQDFRRLTARARRCSPARRFRHARRRRRRLLPPQTGGGGDTGSTLPPVQLTA